MNRNNTNLKEDNDNWRWIFIHRKLRCIQIHLQLSLSSFKFVFLRFTSSFYISSLVFNNSLSNFATLLIIMHSFQPCVDRFSLTGPSQKLKTLWKGQLSHNLLLSFQLTLLKLYSLKKLCQFKLIFINDIFFQWQPTFHHIYYHVGVLMKKNCMATLRTIMVQSENKIS